MLVGRTGSGKSFLANRLISKKNYFEEGNKLESKTWKPQQKKVDFSSGRSVNIIDTQGFGDTSRSSEQVLSDLVDFLDSIKKINICLFCIPATEVRFDSYHKKELEGLSVVLGSGIFDHIYFVITQLDRLKDDDKNKAVTKFKN
jgi:predicted GTPase